MLIGALLLALVLQIPALAALLLSLGALCLTLRGPGCQLAAPVVRFPQST